MRSIKQTQAEFVASRLAAHAASTSNLENDALVREALIAERANEEVRQNNAARKRGEEPVLIQHTEVTPETYKRRQAE
jgi:hypothetical protein